MVYLTGDGLVYLLARFIASLGVVNTTARNTSVEWTWDELADRLGDLLTLVPVQDLRARILEVRREGRDGRWLLVLELYWAGAAAESTSAEDRSIGIVVRVTGLLPPRY